jgi:hypothetical protein
MRSTELAYTEVTPLAQRFGLVLIVRLHGAFCIAEDGAEKKHLFLLAAVR